MDAALLGLDLILNWQVLLAVTLGTALGVAVGVLPGLGSVVGITMVLPFPWSR